MLDLEQIAKRAQECFRSQPAIVIGSGASAAFGMPTMGDLAKHLVEAFESTPGEEEDAWLLVRTALDAGDHLEAALTGKVLPASLVAKIVRETWCLVAKAEETIHDDLLAGVFEYPIATLFEALFRSSNKFVDVVTTNYDRLVEFACEAANVNYASGFLPGYASSVDRSQRYRLRLDGQDLRQVRLWKVHGSMDWFDRSELPPIYAPLFVHPPDNLRPLIVTPGVSKYERILEEPFRSTIQGADDALGSASGYLCFGFGFRDKQIEPRMVERIHAHNVPIVVATRTLTDEARAFLQNKAGNEFLVLEREGEGTRVRTSEDWDGAFIEEDHWSVGGFIKLVA